MKALLVVLLSIVSARTLSAQSMTYHNPGRDWEHGYCTKRQVGEAAPSKLLRVDRAGNIYRTGNFTGTYDFDPGPGRAERTARGMYAEGYVLKLDAAGNFLWVRLFGGSGHYRCEAIELDRSGHLYLTGRFTDTIDFDPGPGTATRVAVGAWFDRGVFSDSYTSHVRSSTYICKLTTDGDLIRVTTIPAGGGYSLAVDSSANVHILGLFAGPPGSPIDFDPGAGTHLLSYPDTRCCGMYILKLDSSGRFIWARNLGVDGDYLRIAVDPVGNVYSVGSFHSDFTDDGLPDPTDFDPGPGRYLLASTGSSENGFVSKLDPSGNFVWARRIGGIGGIRFIDPTLDTSSGSEREPLEGSGDNGFVDLTLDAAYIYLVGYFKDVVDFDPGPDTFALASAGSYDGSILKLDTAGNFAGAFRFGGEGEDSFYGIALDVDGGISAGGMFSDTADVDPGPGVTRLVSTGKPDFVVVTLAPDGSLIRSSSWNRRSSEDTLQKHSQSP